MLDPHGVRCPRLAVGLCALLLSTAGTARGQAPQPAPADAPSEGAAEPGFGEEPAPSPVRRRAAPPPDDDLAPVDVAEPGRNERLIEQINAATGEITLGALLDEILADVVAELERRPAVRVSPLAIREVSLGANVNATFGRKLRSLITAQLHAGTKIRVVRCIECEATRTRIEDGRWVVTRGIVDTAELRLVGQKIGARAFMDVAFGFDPEQGAVEMHFTVVDADSSQVIWADSFRGDETTPMLLRSSEAPMRRKDRLRDLEMLLEGRPFYGYVASAGFMLLPYSDPVEGDIGGATAGYRLYERFGEERRVMFGLDLMGFLNTQRLAGAVLSAGSWWIPFRPDLTSPELRLGAKAGAFIAGTEGNAAVFQLGAEVLLRYRFGLYGYVLFMTKSAFNGHDLGGVGFSSGLSFNW